MKYIIFDTNKLYKSFNNGTDYSKFSLNKDCFNMISFLERHNKNNIYLLVPEVVIRELYKQQCESYEVKLEELTRKFECFKNLTGFSLQLNSFDYPAYLKSQIDNYFKNTRIQILKLCSQETFNRIVERAYEKKAPFEGKDKYSDKGFKDVLIWESIIEFAQVNKGEFIFVTLDNRFHDYENKILIEEFKNRTTQEIKIFHNAESLQTYISNRSDVVANKLFEIKTRIIEENILFIYFNDLDVYGFKIKDFDYYIRYITPRIQKLTIEEVEINQYKVVVNSEVGTYDYGTPLRMSFEFIIIDSSNDELQIDSVEVYLIQDSKKTQVDIEFDI